jgi:hypothetical protein
LDNFVAFAPDALFPLGGYPGEEDKARTLFGQLDQAKTREDFVAAASFLKGRPECSGKIGAVGFCYGGGMVNYLATRLGTDLSAGVAFYGSAPSLEERPEDPLSSADPVGRNRSAHQRELAGLRTGLEGGQRQVRAVPVPRHPARLQQRHHAALRRGGGEAGLGAHGRVLQSARSLSRPDRGRADGPETLAVRHRGIHEPGFDRHAAGPATAKRH